MKSIKYALIQVGYYVYGAGYTVEQAISDCRKNGFGIDPETQKLYTKKKIREMLRGSQRGVDKGFSIISWEDADFDFYMKQNYVFQKKGRGWYFI